MVIIITDDWRNSKMHDNLSWRELVKIAFIKIFTNNFVEALVNILIPCALSVHCANYTKYSQWWHITIFLFGIIVILIFYLL